VFLIILRITAVLRTTSICFCLCKGKGVLSVGWGLKYPCENLISHKTDYSFVKKKLHLQQAVEAHFKRNIYVNKILKLFHTSQEAHQVFITKTNRLTMCREILDTLFWKWFKSIIYKLGKKKQ
jgi:hypothetical protein